MADTSKDTIYIDIDDEITSIIEKLQGSQEKIVALVLPKRATVMQSVVNMKLLKRTADESNKKLVLITSHILSELDDVVSEIIYLQEGKLQFHKSLQQLQEDTGEVKLAKAFAQIMK